MFGTIRRGVRTTPVNRATDNELRTNRNYKRNYRIIRQYRRNEQ